MANHRSALKRHRQSEKKRIRNTSIKSAIKTNTRNVREAVSSGDAEKAGASLKIAISSLDGAVSKGVLHRNNASRKISRLTTAVSAVASK